MMRNKAKIIITKIDNGYIVKVISRGLSILKEPYEKAVMAFNSFTELTDFIQGIFEEESGDE
jgi:hypothetical protein